MYNIRRNIANLLTFLCLVSFENSRQFLVNGRPTVINAIPPTPGPEGDRRGDEVTPLVADSDLNPRVSAPPTQLSCTTHLTEITDKCLEGFEQKLLTFQDPKTTHSEKVDLVMPMCKKYFKTLKCLHDQMLVCPTSTHNLIRQIIERRIGNLREYMMQICMNPPTHAPTTTTTTTNIPTTTTTPPTTTTVPKTTTTFPPMNGQKSSTFVVESGEKVSTAALQRIVLQQQQQQNNHIKQSTTTTTVSPTTTTAPNRGSFHKQIQSNHVPRLPEPTLVVVLDMDLPENSQISQKDSWINDLDSDSHKQSKDSDCNSIQCALGLTSSSYKVNTSFLFVIICTILTFISIH